VVQCESVEVETEDGPEGVLAVKERVPAQPEWALQDVLNERMDKDEPHARRIVKIMARDFLGGAAYEQLREQFKKETDLKRQTFYEGAGLADQLPHYLVADFELHPPRQWHGCLLRHFKERQKVHVESEVCRSS
jgi:hypothetical protein